MERMGSVSLIQIQNNKKKREDKKPFIMTTFTLPRGRNFSWGRIGFVDLIQTQNKKKGER
jgi:hypothetical protein